MLAECLNASEGKQISAFKKQVLAMQENRDSFLGGGRPRGRRYMWSIPTPGLSTDGVHCDVDLSPISEQGLMMNRKDAAVILISASPSSPWQIKYSENVP